MRDGALWPKPARRSARAVMLACALGGLCVWTIPYFVPMAPAVGDSYALGFNNKVAWMLFLAFALWFAWWRGEIEPDAAQEQSSALDLRLLWGALALTLATGAAVWICGARLGRMYEAFYLLDRLDHLAEGRRIFRDFEFAYGAGLLYLPLWLSRGLHLSLESGYYLSLLLESLAGVAMCWSLVREFARKTRHGGAIFLLLFATVWTWSGLFGVQYTPFRYWLGPWLAMWIYRLGMERGRPALALPAALGAVALLLFVSPEQGIALLAGTILFGLLFLLRRGAWFAAGLAAFGAAGLGLVWLLYKAHGLDTAMAMANGGYAIPVTPAPYLVPGLGLVLVTACAVIGAVRRRAAGSVALYLGCCSVFLLPAAFGRFDEIHLLANTLPVALVGWCVVARRERYWRWAWRGYAGLALSLLMAIPVLVSVSVARSILAAPRLPVATLAPGAKVLYSPLGPISPGPGGVFPVQADTGRFMGLENVMNARQADEKVEEIRSYGTQPIIGMIRGCEGHSTQLGVMHKTMGFYARPPRRETHEMDAICREIATQYDPVPGGELPGGFMIMRRRQNAP